jgi:hypothetical protein
MQFMLLLKTLRNYLGNKSCICAAIFRKIQSCRAVLKWHLRKSKIIRFLQENPTDEKQKILEYVKHNVPELVPYSFTKKYNAKNIPVYTDTACGLRYVLHENKKLYFRREMHCADIQSAYRRLLVEQDLASPHRYEYGDFQVKDGDIVADVGAAEGIFSLSISERAGKLYLFENDPAWIEALQMTFAPYKHKVEIINKCVSDNNVNDCVTLDDFFSGERGIVNFIKADIEGAELQLLHGARNLLAEQKKLRIAVCTYHRPDDAEQLKRILEAYSFQTVFSQGYLLLFFDKQEPLVRRGLIRAEKGYI